jgi:hypothetical protein
MVNYDLTVLNYHFRSKCIECPKMTNEKCQMIIDH